MTLTRLSRLSLLLAASALVSGCGGSQTSDRSIAFVGAAEAAEVVHGRKKLLGGSSAGTWVDPRSVREYDEAHIPGAMHLAFEKVRDEHHRLGKFDSIIVYGDDYNSPVAIAMSKTLIELGYKNVYTLRGGLRAWREAGNTIEGE